MSKFLISNKLKENHKLELLEMFQHEWWTVGRTMDGIEIILEKSSFVTTIQDEDKDQLIAFSRILTDHFKYAYIYDVIVEQSYWKQGIGELLLQSIIKDPKLKQIVYIELTCAKEMMPFYQRFNFSDDYGKSVSMRPQRVMKKSGFQYQKDVIHADLPHVLYRLSNTRK